jgi:hypothetical protein
VVLARLKREKGNSLEMEITWLGVMLLPLGAILFTVAPKWLYVITVISIPFTATSLFNTASGAPWSPLQFFGLLLIARQALSLKVGRPIKASCQDYSQLLLILFLGVVILSMIMPWIINGRLWVSSNDLNDLYDEPLRLTVHNVKNPFPVVLGVLLSICWIRNNATPEQIRSTIKVYVLAGVFVSLWGYFQFLCNSIFHIEYPAFLFNNALPESMKGYASQIRVGGELYSRISSVTHEASIFSKYMLTVVPIMVVCVWLRRPLFSIGRDKVVLFIFVGVLILSTSATAYFGVVCMLLVTAVVLERLRLIGRRWVSYTACVGIVVGLLYSALPAFQDIVDALIFMKYESGSVLDRTLSIVNAWEYFKQYPVLGVGWAVVTSHNLLTFLLVSTGVVGFSIFFILIFYVIRRSLQTVARFSANGAVPGSGALVLVAGLVVGLITLVVMGMLTGLEFYLGYFYFILSMLIALNLATRSQLDRTKLGAAWKMMRNVEAT